MAFSQEIKDFVTGFKTGHDMVTSKEDRDLKAAHARYYNSLADRTRSPTDADLGVIPDDGSGSGGHVTTGFDDTRKALSSKEVRAAAQQRFDYLTKDLGWSPAAAAGIIANAHAESRFDTGALGDKGSAHGEFQWRGDRWTGFQDYAKANRLDPERLEIPVQLHGPRSLANAGLQGADEQLQGRLRRSRSLHAPL
jgi:hypothetical protein